MGRPMNRTTRSHQSVVLTMYTTVWYKTRHFSPGTPTQHVLPVVLIRSEMHGGRARTRPQIGVTATQPTPSQHVWPVVLIAAYLQSYVRPVGASGSRLAQLWVDSGKTRGGRARTRPGTDRGDCDAAHSVAARLASRADTQRDGGRARTRPQIRVTATQPTPPQHVWPVVLIAAYLHSWVRPVGASGSRLAQLLGLRENSII